MSRERETFLAWMKQHVLGTKTHEEFMRSAGIAAPGAKERAHG